MSEVENFQVDLNRTLIQDGPKFLSHTLVVKGDFAYLRPTISAMLFCVIYIVVGLFLICLAAYLLFSSDKLDFAIFVGGFGIAITTFGLSLIQPFLKRVSFNRAIGLFSNRKDRNVKLRHIVSLQINNKMVQRKHALSYYCFELNLLTQHGRRINILNHNDLQQILIDAQLLADFLNVEVSDFRREIIL